MTPDEHTTQEFFLDVGDGHKLYVQDWGNDRSKLPLLYLHGGPGNGVSDRDKTKFDPEFERVIFFDQRGAGKSLPKGSLEHNTTAYLVEDVTKILLHLNINKCVLVGSSWGSTLALAFGIAHPSLVAAMVLDGVFTGTQDEIDWLDQGKWADFFPDVWQDYVASVPASHQRDPSAFHVKQALGSDPEASKKSVYAYSRMELALLKLDDRYMPEPYEKFDPAGGRIELHYMTNHCFLDDLYILKNVSRLTMPIYLIQGRYDMVCRPRVAFALHQELPNSQLIWTINGHSKQHEAKNIIRLILSQLTGNG